MLVLVCTDGRMALCQQIQDTHEDTIPIDTTEICILWDEDIDTLLSGLAKIKHSVTKVHIYCSLSPPPCGITQRNAGYMYGADQR